MKTIVIVLIPSLKKISFLYKMLIHLVLEKNTRVNYYRWMLHLLFGKEVSHLHISVDDCTGMIVGAYFDHQETLKSYYKVTAQFLEKYVIPVKILTVRYSVFIYNQKKRRIPLLTKEPLLNMDICVKL